MDHPQSAAGERNPEVVDAIEPVRRGRLAQRMRRDDGQRLDGMGELLDIGQGGAAAPAGLKVTADGALVRPLQLTGAQGVDTGQYRSTLHE